MYKQFGVREICNVVFKAKTDRTIGKKTFKAGQPVIYFDSLKTSSIEGASTTVYAQGGRGNPRLIAWEGERTVTFTMEDALISPIGFAILSGAGLIEADNTATRATHITERVTKDATALDGLKKRVGDASDPTALATEFPIYGLVMAGDVILDSIDITATKESDIISAVQTAITTTYKTQKADAVLLDYYVTKGAGLTQIDIEPDKFGGNFYIEAETLFRDKDGADHAAEFIIPNGKVQSNFTFTMASSGDPSTFTFTVDAFPGYTKFDNSKKVMASLQIIDESPVVGLTYDVVEEAQEPNA